ncbi:MAG TPA: phosphate acetyltransferase [Firmicutes bacterium]|nr:phosphate acetyltransferase [Bacillota bacterium]
MSLLQSVREKAKKACKTIVLAEGEEKRVLDAAKVILDEKIAGLVLIGNKGVIAQKAAFDVNQVTIVDPASDNLDEYADLLYELRKAKGMEKEQAAQLVKNPLYLGVMLVKTGKADGMVAGSVNSTGDTLRPALQIIKTAPGIKTVSSCFIMVLPEGSKYGENGVMVFADCAVNIEPDAEQLASIAIASADTAKKIAGIDPKIAMLSFSTKGSAKHANVDKVVEATKIVNTIAPELQCDGELQLDAAIVESVAQLKAPGSKIAGHANVLIFPDLQSGNIGYKLVQRLAGAQAVGPICQGFNKPVNDLSRGCSSEDIVNVVAMTVLQA